MNTPHNPLHNATHDAGSTAGIPFYAHPSANGFGDYDAAIDPTPESVDMTGEGGIRGPPQACLYVAGIAPETTETTLRNLFGSFGELVRIRIILTQSRPYAFVQYKTIESADLALSSAANQSLDGRRIRVERARVNRTLFIAKIDRNLSSGQIREIMEEHGEVENVTLIKSYHTQKSKGCGFVKYLYREDANKAFAALKLSQKKWVIEWAQSNNDPESLGVDKCNLFVGGLNPSAVTKELLSQRFSNYGTVESVTIINKDPDVNEAQDANFPRSAFAFVRYSDAASSATAIEHENGVEWLDRKIRVQYCESQEMKNKRKTNKYINYVQSYAQQFYPRMSPVAPPFMYPYPMYNMPVAPQPTIPRKGQENAPQEFQQPYIPYPYMMYNQQYLYAAQLQQQQQYLQANGEYQNDPSSVEHDTYEDQGDESQGVAEKLHAMGIRTDHGDSAAK